MILIDIHEPKSILNALKLRNAEFEREFLEVGDYILPEEIAIERKTGSDFLSSIIDGRLWEQASNLSQYKHPILALVTENLWKDMYYTNDRYVHKRFYGALSTLISKFNISVLVFSSENDFIDFIIQLDEKISSKKETSRPKPYTRKPKSIKERQENMLSMIEGVSIKKAHLLLKKFKNIKNISNLSIDELMKVEGIGKKLANNIFEVFNHEE